MSFFWATIYGIIQGVTEFLPVSSSGHLAVLPYFFSFKDPGVMFDLMMHLGTALAVMLYFYKDILLLFKEFIFIFTKKSFKYSSFFINFSVATFFSILGIFILKETAFTYGRYPLLIAINLIFFGLIMWWSDKKGSEFGDMVGGLELKRAIVIGLGQCLAIFPGVSRSGITLTAGRFLGLSRFEAGRFSFLLSLPIIVGSSLYKWNAIFNNEKNVVEGEVLLYGVACSFIFGILTIHFFLKFISKVGLGHFTLYRVLLGLGLIALILSRATT